MKLVTFILVNDNKYLPMKSTSKAACYDLKARLDFMENNSIIISPGERIVIPTGLKLRMQDMHAEVRPRSGLAAKEGIVAILGTIDEDYKEEVGVILFNLGKSDFTVKDGDRIAQLYLSERDHCIVDKDGNPLNCIKNVERESGFGSTGV